MLFFKLTSAFFTCSAYRQANRYTCFYHLTNRIIQYLMQEIKKKIFLDTEIKLISYKKNQKNSMTDKKQLNTDAIFINLIEQLLLCCANARGLTLKPRLYYANKAKDVQY